MAQKSNANIMTQMAIDQAVIINKLTNVEKDVATISDRLEKDYVTQDQFQPVQKIVYGLVGLILVAVVTAVIALVIKQ